jgi:hypothetical protein
MLYLFRNLILLSLEFVLMIHNIYIFKDKNNHHLFLFVEKIYNNN